MIISKDDGVPIFAMSGDNHIAHLLEEHLGLIRYFETLCEIPCSANLHRPVGETWQWKLHKIFDWLGIVCAREHEHQQPTTRVVFQQIQERDRMRLTSAEFPIMYIMSTMPQSMRYAALGASAQFGTPMTMPSELWRAMSRMSMIGGELAFFVYCSLRGNVGRDGCSCCS
jgi:hypothetical protein